MKRAMSVGGAFFALALSGAAWAQDAGRNPEDLFKTLDKNGDGVLKADEVGEERARFFERLLRVADKDGNGALSREEFIAGSRNEERPADRPSGDRPGGDRPEGRPAEGRPDGRRLFERFDANKDGKLTKDELPEDARTRLAPVFERLGKNELTQEEFGRAMAQAGGRPEGAGGRDVEEAFRRADTNGDGKVTLDEAPENMRPILNGVFRRLQKEPKDGITLDELRRAMADRRPGEGRPAEGRPAEGRPPEGRPAEARPGEGRPGEPRPEGARPLPRIFQLADTNGDGRVSKEELTKLAEKFSELDENKDGQLDPRELLGPPPGAPREGRPEERRPDGGRPEGDRPNRPEGNRPEGKRPEGDRPAGRPEGRAREEIGELFRRQDKNEDGKISKDEAQNRIQEHFGELDADKDGFLTREEVARGLLRRAQEGGGERRRPDGERPRENNPEKKPE